MLTGDNGIIRNAQEAKVKTEKESAREQIQLEVIGALDNYGDVKLATLKTNLQTNENADVTSIEDIQIDNALTGKISLDGYDFYVDENGKVLDYDGPVGTPTPEKSTKTAFSRANGRIDIVFLNGTGYNVTETPNTPALDNTMVPVYYDDTNSVWKVCSASDTTTWYRYEAADVRKAGADVDDNKQSRWANVMLTDNIVVEKDGATYTTAQIKNLLTNNSLSTIVGATVTTEGSMLVWIPRYAYKITYYSSSAKTSGKEVGYSDSRGLVDTEGKTPSDLQTPTTSVNVTGTIGTTNYEYYRPHPAFETDKDQGGWSTKITGIWVGKFEATGSLTDVTTLSNTVALKGSSATVGALYNAIESKLKSGSTESHMMKNSEWGAISYLTESKYGRNEVPVTRNTNSSYYTGGNRYKTNTLQSTTGNIYGVYDTVGGVYEYVASYIANSKYSYGYQFASTVIQPTSKNDKKTSTPYSTVYKYDDKSDTSTNNYALSLNKMFGDAIAETSTAESGATSWNSAYSNFVCSFNPFFRRGGNCDNSRAGSFCFSYSNGNGFDSYGSRVVCVVK